ncbi:L-type lectin-domain containing receptor kinase IX.1-like isoform X2 [Hibiscus syriacus]|uniref:L-type lectin-domain containing receptor kinase IX.1-like isoform X2 n=1 Tax=Hibiscus syriacus TaxID=106335 RepID=UPI001921FEEA|nr:L-type lectin-domain containing receptor kinase IX.1-like isoform X2 [Hibiscus syriacus]
MRWDNVLEAFALNYSQGKINNKGVFIACYYYPIGNIPGKRQTQGIEFLIQPVVAPISPTAIPYHPPSPDTFPSKKSKSMVGLVIGLSIGSTFGLVLLITCVILRQKWKREKKFDDDHVFDILFNDEFNNMIGPRKFSLNELARATSNFSTDNKLGEGGFGSVYKGLLRDLDTYVAVKRVSKASKQGIREYASEVKIISRLRHKNMVKLIGWCHDRGELLLIYEFMPNGSLDAHLFKGKSLLTWETRYKIVQDLASALLYLHEEGDYCVLHRDIKTNNILLDSSFNAKLGDFGLARLVDHSKGLKNTLLAGTMGYIAPECLSSGKTSKESDVYSFGVVALEIACGRRSIEPKFQDFEAVLVPWVWKLYGEGKVLDVADHKMRMVFDPKQMECLVMVGLWCAHPSQDQRPSIRQVIQSLHFEAPLPNLPGTMPIPSYNTPTAPCIESSNPPVSNMTLTFPR